MVPFISIITTSYNTPLWIFKKHLQAIADQKYPSSKIEHIVMDGGSDNGSVELMRSFGVNAIVRKDLLHKAQTRAALAIKKTKGDIVLILEPDNILPHKMWMRQMVAPFAHREVVGSFSLYNSYTADMPLVTRYCALMGLSDPVVFYLGKSEKLPRYEFSYKLGEKIFSAKDYFLVRFGKNNLPTLGDNGHMVRRSAIIKVIKNPSDYIHIDAFFDLLKYGHNTYGVVKNDIIHYSGSNLISLYKRRASYKEQFFNGKYHKRKYYLFNKKSPKDWLNMVKFIIYTITFVEPLSISLRGFAVVHDLAWFLHPLACFLALWFYSLSEFSLFLKHFYVNFLKLVYNRKRYGKK